MSNDGSAINDQRSDAGNIQGSEEKLGEQIILSPEDQAIYRVAMQTGKTSQKELENKAAVKSESTAEKDSSSTNIHRNAQDILSMIKKGMDSEGNLNPATRESIAKQFKQSPDPRALKDELNTLAKDSGIVASYDHDALVACKFDKNLTGYDRLPIESMKNHRSTATKGEISQAVDFLNKLNGSDSRRIVPSDQELPQKTKDEGKQLLSNLFSKERDPNALASRMNRQLDSNHRVRYEHSINIKVRNSEEISGFRHNRIDIDDRK